MENVILMIKIKTMIPQIRDQLNLGADTVLDPWTITRFCIQMVDGLRSPPVPVGPQNSNLIRCWMPERRDATTLLVTREPLRSLLMWTPTVLPPVPAPAKTKDHESHG